MRYITICILSLCFILDLISVTIVSAQRPDTLERPRIALVLSGGGAKGFAHIGVLRVIDSLRIPVDLIVGTSMGSIIGGFYAMGYSIDEIEELVLKQDWDHLLTDKVSRKNIPLSIRDEYDRYTLSFPIRSGRGFHLPKGLVYGQNIMNLFCRLSYEKQGVDKMENMPVRFACVAMDVVTGKEVVIDSGNVAEAMRASMSIPYIFTPVDKEDMLLIDGGMRNNFPVNVAKELGADIVIGVDVQKGIRSKKEIRSVNDLMNQTVYFLGEEAYGQSLKNVDIYIKPDMRGYGVPDFYDADSLIERGKRAALENIGQLKDLQRYGSPDSSERREEWWKERMFIRHIKFSGLKNIPEERVKWRLTFRCPGFVTVGRIQESIDRMYGTLGFETIYYRLEGDDRDTLNFIMKEKLMNTFNVGLHFDTWANASLLLNTTFRSNVARNGSIISLNLKLSEFPRFLASYTLDNGARPGMKIAVDFNHFKFYDYVNGHKVKDVKATTVNFDASVISVFRDSYSIGAGVNLEYFKCDIEDKVLRAGRREEDFLLNYFAYVRLDTRERSNYAKTGMKLTARFRKITGNGLNYRDDYSLYSGYFEFIKPFNVGSLTALTFIPQLYVAGFLGRRGEAPLISQVSVGGPVFANDLMNHIPFIGLRPFELLHNGAMVLRADFQWEMWKRNYLIYKINVLKTSEFTSLRDYKVGMGLTFGYDSVIGPIEATVSWARVGNRFGGFANVGYWF